MSDARDVRIVAQWRDDPTEALMTLDARIEETRIVSSWDLFGAFDLNGPKRRPFILRRDGAIDFGTDEVWRTDLRTTEIKICVEFSVHFNEADRGCYRIVKIAMLGAKDGK